MSYFTIHCPKCSAILEVDNTLIGGQGECPSCSFIFTINPPVQLRQQIVNINSKPNFSQFHPYAYYIYTNNDRRKSVFNILCNREKRTIWALNEQDAIQRATAILSNGESIDTDEYPTKSDNKKGLTCPNCGSAYTYCYRANTGYIVICSIILAFISCGIGLLGLLLIPLQKHTCWCSACKYRWKS